MPDKEMKKRAAEGIALLAAMIIAFIVFNAVINGVGDATRKIDGDYYNTGERELTLALMTEEGTENLADFTRLEKLKISPYKQAVLDSLNAESREQLEAVRADMERAYPDYTDLEDISFLSELTWIKELDISGCGTDNIDFIAGYENLTSLNISGTNVMSLEPLRNADSITELYISYIPAIDLSPLKDMASLERVYVEVERVKDIPELHNVMISQGFKESDK